MSLGKAMVNKHFKYRNWIVGLLSLVGCGSEGEGAPAPSGAAAGAAVSDQVTADSDGNGGGVDGLLALANDLASDSEKAEAMSPVAPEPETFVPVESEPEPEPVFPEARSCSGQTPTSCQEGSCCERLMVSTAEVLHVDQYRDADLSPFLMDKYEVTVGRFRSFVLDFESWRNAGNPVLGAGALPNVEASGWLSSQDVWAQTQRELRAGIACNVAQQTWTEDPGLNEVKPMNCLSWFEAYAFCIWDGGRLATELEWQYAAMGGSEGRVHPWGGSPSRVSDPFALYGCQGAGTATAASCTKDDILNVGSRSQGNGRYGQSDLVGSVFEWVVDWYAPYPEVFQPNYARVDDGTDKVLRGGGWINTMSEVLVSNDRSTVRPPEFRSPNTGARCVRDVESVLY